MAKPALTRLFQPPLALFGPSATFESIFAGILHVSNATNAPKTLLVRLARDKRGNTIAMSCAAMVPLLGMIGSGVDVSRAYLVKSRLQQACDSGALAGRKSMAGTTLTTADKQQAERFFRFSFPNGTMGTTPITFDPAATSAAQNALFIDQDANQQLRMRVSTTMPNAFMQILGYPTQQIAVNCTGEEYYVNTDVMLVLDTTGSMNCWVSDATSCSQATEKPDGLGSDQRSKMKALREAAVQLYTDLRPAQVALEAKSLRMRIGWVPYSTTVNVGKLVYGITVSGVNVGATYFNNPGTYRNSANNNYSGPTQTAAWFTGTGASDWEGCIVERSTAVISTTATSIPTGAYDMDMATMPTSPSLRWTPMVKQLYQRNALGATNYDTVTDLNRKACVKPAVKLQSWASIADFSAEIAKINTGAGYTYHDIGMIWGTRLIANAGILAHDNPNTYNGVKVRRTIVLFTDGALLADQDVYGAYGVERYDARVAGGGGSLTQRHVKRFELMCARAKSTYGIDIWVVAMLDSSTAMPASLTNCASNTAQALKVGNTADLSDAFRAISDKVGNLRISG